MSPVHSRPIRLVGESSPWDVTVCTVTDSDCLRKPFGENLKGTVAMKLKVDCMVDVKRQLTVPVDLEVEVGIPFDYAHFRSVGGKGKILATDGTREGYTLTVVLTENKRHYPYNDPDWQQAASHYAREHVYGALTAGLSAEQRAFVSVSAIATSAVKPLNLLVRQQSAKGLHAHLLVKQGGRLYGAPGRHGRRGAGTAHPAQRAHLGWRSVCGRAHAHCLDRTD